MNNKKMTIGQAYLEGKQAGYRGFDSGKDKVANPYEGHQGAFWEVGYCDGFTKCGEDHQTAFEREDCY